MLPLLDMKRCDVVRKNLNAGRGEQVQFHEVVSVVGGTDGKVEGLTPQEHAWQLAWQLTEPSLVDQITCIRWKQREQVGWLVHYSAPATSHLRWLTLVILRSSCIENVRVTVIASFHYTSP